MMRIARNDPALAHACARTEIRNLRAGTARLIRRLPSLTCAKGAAAIQAHFGPLIVADKIVRVKGTRAKAQWLALDAADDHDDLVLLSIKMDIYGWTVTEADIRLSAHTVARMAQRTLGTADVRLAASILRLHCMAAILRGREAPEHATVITATGDGALLWLRHGEFGMRANTWLDAETASDPDILTACQTAGDGILARIRNGTTRQ